MGKIGIRGRIILMVAGALVLAISAAAFMIRDMVYQNILDQKITTAEVLAASIVHDIKYDIDTQKQISIDNIISKYMTYYRIIDGIHYYDNRLMVVASSDGSRTGIESTDPDVIAAIKSAKPTLTVTQFGWERLGIRSISPVLRGSKIVGAVALDISMEDIEDILSQINQRILTITLIIVLLASCTVFFMLRHQILSRLNKLMAVTREIASGNYEISINDRRSDELGELSRAFEQMAADLRQSRREVESYNKKLEKEIKDATGELQEMYENLKSAQGQIVLNEKMASLGVLIAGIAHEINTPVGAINNISRNLQSKIYSMPELLARFGGGGALAGEKLEECLRRVINDASRLNKHASFKEVRALERMLAGKGLANAKDAARSLANLNITDPGFIDEYIEYIRLPSMIRLVEVIGSIAQAARISETSSKKIQGIIKALKFYAYTDKDKIEATRINESIETSLVLLENRLKHLARIHVEFDDDIPPIPSTSEIHQVWTNILNNAADAIEEMGEGYKGEIAIRTCARDGQAHISIQDNGVGMSEDTVKKIFDPFFTTKDVGKGTGLGLSIVSGIISKHNGSISVRSRRGHTVFDIAIPFEGISEIAESAPAGPEAAGLSVT